MKEFGTLLKKLYSSLNRDVVERENILYTLKNTTGITLTSSDLFIREGVLEISASPVVKNEIKLKEEAILEALKNSYNLSYSRVLYK
jgi:hypothetical protein